MIREKKLAEITHDVVEERPENVEEDHRTHERKEHPVLALGQEIIQRRPGCQGERQVDHGNAQSAAHIHGEQSLVSAEVA